jgi:hypothetical protein
MNFRLTVLLFALCFSGIARAEEEPAMTKIVVRMLALSAAGNLVPEKPKTMYVAGEKYARVEELPDAKAGGQKLIVTNEPDSWIINLTDKTAKHLVDSGPKFVTHAPIFWTTSGQPEPEFDDLEFGAELKFFGGGRGLDLKPRTLDGRRCKVISIKTGPHEALLFLDPKSEKPYQINLIKFGRLVSAVRYVSYETDIPFKASLFQPPEGIQITGSY